jgi:hypothetical protein
MMLGLSDIDRASLAKPCGMRGADVRPNFHWEREQRAALTDA